MNHSNEFLRLVEEAKGRIREITPETLKQWMDEGKSFKLIDVREDMEWQQGHLEGALHLARGILERDIKKSAKTDEEIVLYCGGGYRSALAADNLQKMGYKSVYSLSEGVRGWIERDYSFSDVI